MQTLTKTKTNRKWKITLILLESRTSASAHIRNKNKTIMIWNLLEINTEHFHCVEIVRIRSYSGRHFSAFGLNSVRMRGNVTQNNFECRQILRSVS